MGSSTDDTSRTDAEMDAQRAPVGDQPTGVTEETPEVPRPGATEVAEHIRTQSRAADLTDPAVFADEPFLLNEDELARVMGELARDEAYADIVRTTDELTGTEYLHSTTFLTVTYAKHLLRARANDPVFLIAQTVRDNARVYPRPTPLEFFEGEPFDLRLDDVLTYVKAIAADEAYADIKPVTVSTGMVCLYSDKFLSQARAQALAQWAEVDMHLDSNQ